MRYLTFLLLGSTLALTACKKGKTAAVKTATSKIACFKVVGMTCATCSTTLKASVKKLNGINSVSASSDEGSAEVSYEPSKVSSKTIQKNINSVGYKATERACQESKG